MLVACGGGEDQSTATTQETITSVSGNMTGVSATTGPGEPTDTSDTTPTSDSSTSPPAPGAPVFLSLKTNVSKVTAGEMVVFTAILTDPDGVDDIVGGELSDTSGVIGYGPFVAAGQEGTYSITLSWDAMHQAEAIQFEGMDLARVFRAEFYDQAANKVSEDVNLALTCAEGSACDGVCVDIMADAEHCGACGGVCEGGCDAGQCAPKWGECIRYDSGFDTCDAYCTSIGEACAEDGCAPNDATIRAYGGANSCETQQSGKTLSQPCNTIETWGIGRSDIRCCCTDTQ